MASSPAAAPRPVDSPLQIPHISVTFDKDDNNASALKLVHELSPEWKDSEGAVTFVRFTDGITNTLVKATKERPGKSQDENDDDAILIRAYGRGTDVIIDREKEIRAHNLLATHGMAPPLLARFDNGLMYRFLKGTPCQYEDFARPEVYRQVAKRLGEWHGSLPISAITTTPRLDSVTQDKHLGPTKDGKHERPHPNVWTVAQQWIDILAKNTKTDEQKAHITTLQSELDWLSSKLGQTPGLIDGRDYVFAHTDLLCGNVIVQPGENKERPVYFIDYEYACPGPAAFDIANHFAEWAGYDCDHAAVPTKSQRLEFLKHYVGSFRMHSISDDPQLLEIDMKKDIDTLYDQVQIYRGVPGFYWGIWGMIQALISEIDFDYDTYAKLRLSEYWGWKQELDGSRVKQGKEMTVREKKWAQD